QGFCGMQLYMKSAVGFGPSPDPDGVFFRNDGCYSPSVAAAVWLDEDGRMTPQGRQELLGVLQFLSRREVGTKGRLLLEHLIGLQFSAQGLSQKQNVRVLIHTGYMGFIS